jgi:hypothetical protein
MKHSLSEQQEIVIQSQKELYSISSEKSKNDIKYLVMEGVGEICMSRVTCNSSWLIAKFVISSRGETSL